MRLEYIAGSSAKFWEVEVQGPTVITRWGRIGTKGQEKVKTWPTASKASADAEKQRQKKEAKGYAPAGSAPAGTNTDPTAPKADLADGEETEFKSSSGRTYTLRNLDGVWSCSCPAWLHQSAGIDQRTCKHLRAFRGEAAETARLGALPAPALRKAAAKESAPPVLLAQSWEEQDPTGWWLSEKLDGVRAWWDGTRFLSRQGNVFHAPGWFVAALPDHPLDGELFGGRGNFQQTVSIARRVQAGERWKQLTYVVFDMPEHPGPFEERLEAARHLDLGPHAEVLVHVPCRGTAHLRRELARIEGLQGEGLMLRKPGSAYHHGRSEVLLKVKTFHDAEAVVTGHQPGAGKHKGRLGALEVELPDGTTFKIGTGFTEHQRENPPAIGSTVTFRFQELTKAGVPRFPSFVRERPDP